MASIKFFCCALGLAATPVSALECDFYGDLAAVVHSDYEAHVNAGTPQPLEHTKDLVSFDLLDAGTMGHAFYTAILNALQAGQSEDAVREVGRAVCLSYPAGTFDPDSFE